MDIRWIQRFNNYQKALKQLDLAHEQWSQRALNELEQQGVIQAFEYTFELAWKVIKDFYQHQGETGLQGSRDAFRLAFQRGLIESGEVWMDMIEKRNLTVHTYNENTSQLILKAIQVEFYPQFQNLKRVLAGHQSDGSDG